MSVFETIRFDGSPYHFELYLNFQTLAKSGGACSLNKLAREVFPASMSAFGQPDSPEFYADVFDHVCTSDSLIVCRLGSRAVGFASFKDIPELDTLFLNGIALHTEHHSHHIARRVIDSMVQRIPRARLAFTTQNPRMYELARRLGNKILPCSEKDISEEERVYCAQLLRGRPGVHELSRCVVRELYSSCMYPSLPTCSNQEVDSWFCSELSVDGNRRTRDGMLVVSVLK